MKKNVSKNSIKNIIFDLGGVIVDLDINLTIQTFKDIGVRDFENLYTQAKQISLFDRLDRGEINHSEFQTELRNIAGIDISDSQIDDAWNAMLKEMPFSRLLLLEKVKSNYKTFLLSNTNDLHIKTFNKYLKKEFNLDSIDKYFDRTYLSYKMGMRKPETSIFEFVINENSLESSETLFIDDTIQHIESASQIGIITYHLNSWDEYLDDLFEEGKLKSSVIYQITNKK